MTSASDNPDNTPMNLWSPAQHRRSAAMWLEKADEWAARASTNSPDWSAVNSAVARAQVHATLALSAGKWATPWGDPFGIAP